MVILAEGGRGNYRDKDYLVIRLKLLSTYYPWLLFTPKIFLFDVATYVFSFYID